MVLGTEEPTLVEELVSAVRKRSEGKIVLEELEMVSPMPALLNLFLVYCHCSFPINPKFTGFQNLGFGRRI